eukprot:4732706-Heterocapsa_arctica.AAC.1
MRWSNDRQHAFADASSPSCTCRGSTPSCSSHSAAGRPAPAYAGRREPPCSGRRRAGSLDEGTIPRFPSCDKSTSST